MIDWIINNKLKPLNKLEYFLCILISLLVVYFQFLIFNEIEVYSDNYHYSDAYNKIKSENLINGYSYFTWRTSGSEPISYFIFFISSKLINYKTFIFISNVVFYSLLAIYLRKKKINLLFIFYILMSNYYFTVMSIGIHRVKLAFIFIFILILYKGRNKLTLILSPLAHFQIFTIYSSIYISSFFKNKFENLKSIRNKFLIFSIFVIVIYFLSKFSKILTKFYGRLDLYPSDLVISLIITFIFSITFLKKKKEIIMYLITISIITGLLGGFRMNMILFISLFFISSSFEKMKFITFYSIVSIYLIYKIYYLYNNHYLLNLFN